MWLVCSGWDGGNAFYAPTAASAGGDGGMLLLSGTPGFTGLSYFECN
jgi:hypothetical protein